MLLLLFKSLAEATQGQGSVGGGGGRKATDEDFGRLFKRLGVDDVADEEIRPKSPARARRTKERIIAQAASMEIGDDAADRLRELWRRWYLAEMGGPVDESYARFQQALAARMADERMESEIEDMLILLAVATVI
jgi:hypothetical protein